MAEDLGGERVGSGLTLGEDGKPVPVKGDHVAEGLCFLLGQFQGKPRLEALLATFLSQVQDLETALYGLFTKRTLWTSEGVQLDGLGRIVGEVRSGRTDAVYRRFLQVRVLVNRSNGQLEDLYSIALLSLQGGLVPVVVIREWAPKAVVVYLLTDVGGADIGAMEAWRLLREAADAGVHLSLIYAVSSANFTWGDSNAAPVTDATHGWGDIPGGTIGGQLTSVVSG